MPLYPQGNAPKPRRATYGGEDEASRAAARGVTYAGRTVGKSDYLSRLMAYARARAAAYLRSGGPGLGPSYPANMTYPNQPQRNYLANYTGPITAARAAPVSRPAVYDYTSEAARARNRMVTYSAQPYPLRKQAKKPGARPIDYPSEAEVSAGKMYRPPEVMQGGAAGGGGGYGAGGYGGYGGYGYGGGGGGGGGGGYRGPAYYGQEQPYRPNYVLRPDIPAWLQAMVTWNIGG